MESQFDDILQRIRARQTELSDYSKENDVLPEQVKQEEVPPSPTKVLGISVKSNDAETPKKVANSSTTGSTKKSRFSALAEELDEFEFDYTSQYNKPKEAYMKGRSPRMSIGETRPAVLCTPAGAAAMKSPNVAKTSPIVKFAQPMVNVNYLPNESSMFSTSETSTVLGGSELTSGTTSSFEVSMNQQITNENTVINAQSCDNREAILREREGGNSEEYGAHTFMRLRAPKPTEQPALHTIVSSPKPYSKDVGKSVFSPVHFAPQSTSSPILTRSEMSPAKSAALQNSVAKTRMLQFEQKFQTNKSVPVQVSTPPAQVQTQWRGQANTPIVQGARAEDKTAGNEVLGAGVGKLKNLKSRWEFSSTTGTPIHPDATEDSLIATAIKMKETAIPNKISNRSLIGRKGPSGTSISSQPQAVRSTTASPASKSLRYEESDEDDDEEVFDEIKRAQEQKEEEEIPSADTSRFIDHAFGFIEGAGTGTPSPFRMDRIERSLSPRQHHNFDAEIIEEEDVPVGDTDEEDEEEIEETVEHPVEMPHRVVEEKSRKDSSSLPYSVSFYRKIQRERVNDAANTSPLPSYASPSAPPTSLTSPQKLRQLTSGHAASESVREKMQRLQTAIRVEEQLVEQSKRAMLFSREKPSFRGSREEFEAQWALLVHVEKHRALVQELDRLKREGPRIVDGPRGNITISRLTVNMARDYLSAHLPSTRKPDEVYYFTAVVRYGEQVEVSKMVTSDAALQRKGCLDFPTPLHLTSLPPDFKAIVEIYGQRSMREATSHEDKYKLKGTTLKTKTRTTFLGGNTSMFVPPSSQSSASLNSNFNLLGTFSFDINCPHKKTYAMAHTVHPLDGVVFMKVRKQAIDGSDVSFRGFMSMYHRTREGLGSWTRYWCVVEHGELKFWKHPEDETTKGWLVLLDLSTCCRPEGATVIDDICPFPNSFNIDVWVPREEAAGTADGGVEPLRVMLAADTPVDLQKWLSVINSTSKQLCTWRNPMAQ